MADRLNPAEQSAAESDYQKKFNRSQPKDTKAANDIKKQEESGGDASWKTVAKKKKSDDIAQKKGKFRFAGRHAGKVRSGSAFAFILVFIGLGVWYSSVFAPNILLVNIKEMYTNDLADSTVALDTYYKKMMNYKIGNAQCGETDSIKCKLSTMSRSQKEAFEKAGFTVLASKVKEDNLDDGQPSNDQPESRYQVTAVLPPSYNEIIDKVTSSGTSVLNSIMSGNFDAASSSLGSSFGDLGNKQITEYAEGLINKAPIINGDMLWLYSQLSSGTKAQVYSVFNPKSSFYMDTRFKQRLKQKYDLTKQVTVTGTSEKAVNKSFDNSMKGSSEGIDEFGRPNASGGISLGSLSNPLNAVNMQLAARNLANSANSFTSLQCAWYSYGKAITNNAKTAKSHTLARFAMQYLKAADAIKAGTSEEIPTNVLSSKLAQSTGGGYGGKNATDSSMYKAITYGELPVPSPYGLAYYHYTYDLLGALIPAWSQIMVTSAAVGAASGAPGQLSMPPANLLGTDRDYCLSGETTENKAPIKTADCTEAITASAPPGFQGALAPTLQVGRETCPQPHYDVEDQKYEGEYIIQPSVKATDATLTAYISGLFSVSAIAWANVASQLFTSSTTGIAASDAIFAGTGEILGDMAMSRGMVPGNVATMTEYLALKPAIDKEYNEVAQYNARQNPFDAYNKFSFLGSIVHGLTPTYDDKAPLFSTLANSLSLVGDGIKRLDPSADAIYYSQPNPFNPLRLSCIDPEYLAIGIMADTACNVRYSMSRLELAAQVDSVLDYMTQSHSDATSDGIQELQQRLATADDEGDREIIGLQLQRAQTASQQPYIDKKTGKATKNGEYEKYLDYCVNRQDPWGRSGIAIHRSDLPDDVKIRMMLDKTGDGEAISTLDSGDPYQQIPDGAYSSITEGTKADQDWYTGKKCLEISEMMTNFRAYTMACSVDGSFSGGVDCTDLDYTSNSYTNAFYTSNDILYTSWY